MERMSMPSRATRADVFGGFTDGSSGNAAGDLEEIEAGKASEDGGAQGDGAPGPWFWAPRSPATRSRRSATESGPGTKPDRELAGRCALGVAF